MATDLIENQNIIQGEQLEDVKEYIRFLKILNKDEKKEFHGMMRGMQIMKNMMQNNAV